MHDGFQPQTNIVRHDGQRAVLVNILKYGTASTLDIVDRVKAELPRMQAGLPPDLTIKIATDQSIFVRAAVDGVIHEAILAGCLTALMILLFLGSWRSTLIIAVTIPLAILTSIIALFALGETINIMTLGGLALAVGILVDDATVAIENISQHLEQGKPLEQAILDGAQQIADPDLRLHAGDLHRVRADVPAHRRGALPVRAAGRGGCVRDARLLLILADAGADAGQIPAARRAC